MRPERIDMLGLGLDISSIEETIGRFIAHVRGGTRGYCCVTLRLAVTRSPRPRQEYHAS